MYTLCRSALTAFLSAHALATHALSDSEQIIMKSSKSYKSKLTSTITTDAPKIAIIGAGITGASAAHHLHQLARLHQPLDITVFESEDRVGGRIKSAYVHGEPGLDVETGAASFSKDDWCLKEAMQEVGLKQTPRPHEEDRIGVWDGNEFLVEFTTTDNPFSNSKWWPSKWLLRYGSSLPRLQDMILDSAKRFSSFAIFQAFLNLSKKLENTFIHDYIFSSSSSFLESDQVNPQLANEIVRPASRYVHGRDLDEIDALSSILALRQSPKVSIYQGNRRLPHRMLKISEAQVRLNTGITRISIGTQRPWKLDVEVPDVSEQHLSSEEFDVVILTAPFASNEIAIDPPLSAATSLAEPQAFLERHITLFSTLQPFSPLYFKRPANATLPGVILTAPSKLSSEPANDIFSIEIVDRVAPPDSGDCEEELEYVYKIFSSKPIPDDHIAHLLGHYMETPTPDSPSRVPLSDIGVTWVHRQAWPHAYPQFKPGRPILDNIEIAPDLYYTAAAEEALSTMEMGCRMGLNVAKHLYYSKWVGETIP